MTLDNWIHHANVALEKRYCITLSDSGLTDDEFIKYYGGQRPEVAVEQYALHYDLTPRGPWNT